MSLRRTKNSNLQTQLDAWVAALTAVSALAMHSPERLAACVDFCRTFVTADVEEDDVQYFANNIATDEVNALSFKVFDVFTGIFRVTDS